MKKTFVCEANDCVHFHLFEGDKGEEKTFEPEFAHQVFREDETIYGYSEDLSVDVLCAPNTFEPRFVDVTYGGRKCDRV